MGGSSYYVTFIDDFSRYTWLYFLKHKDEVLPMFKNFNRLVEKEFDAYITCLRSDNGGEYVSNAFDDFLAYNGIRRELTCPHTPQQNGVAERKKRVFVEAARAMLNEKFLPDAYWAEAMSTAVYVVNRTPTAGIHMITPYEKLYKQRPDVSHLKVFGSIAYVHIPDELRTKLDPKVEKCVFIGYSLEQKGYKCCNPVTRRQLLQVSIDVVFDEMASW